MPRLSPGFHGPFGVPLSEIVLALLLALGLYFPTSTNGEHSALLALLAASVAFVLLLSLAWTRGLRREAGSSVMLLLIIPVGFTLVACLKASLQFDWGVFARFWLLSLMLALDLRAVLPGRLVFYTALFTNLVNITCGVAILVGSDSLNGFISTYYWGFNSDLVPNMLHLHKPVLSFGTHSVAAFFLYLFFWLNWESYKLRRSHVALFFAFSYFVLLMALTSFTSMGLGALAMAQVGFWLWKHNRRLAIIGFACIVLFLALGIRTLATELDEIRQLPQFAEAVFLNSDLSGPMSRFGPGGELQNALAYWLNHPWSPVGFARGASAYDVETSSQFFIGDSGPIEYLLRGSVPLVLLIYFGLYRFLKDNLISRRHALTIFFVTVLFEVGFPALNYFRTYYLLPFFVVALNSISSVSQRGQLRSTGPSCSLQ